MCRWRQARVGSGGIFLALGPAWRMTRQCNRGSPLAGAGSGMQPPRSGRYPTWPDVLTRLLIAASLLASQSSARKNLVVDGPFPLTDLSGRGPRGATRRGGLGRMPFSEDPSKSGLIRKHTGRWCRRCLKDRRHGWRKEGGGSNSPADRAMPWLDGSFGIWTR
jgi:hypothetical protein